MRSDSTSGVAEQLRAGLGALAGLDSDVLSHSEVLGLLEQIEVTRRRLPALEHRLLARLDAEASPVALGAKNIAEVLAERLRISAREASRRFGEAADLGPRRALTGEALVPRLTATADAQAAGAVNAEHVAIIRKFFTDLPEAVDGETRDWSRSSSRPPRNSWTPPPTGCGPPAPTGSRSLAGAPCCPCAM